MLIIEVDLVLVIAEFVGVFDEVVAGNREGFAVAEGDIVIAGNFIGAVVVADLKLAVIGERGTVVRKLILLGVSEVEILVVAFAINESAAGQGVFDDIIGGTLRDLDFRETDGHRCSFDAGVNFASLLVENKFIENNEHA